MVYVSIDNLRVDLGTCRKTGTLVAKLKLIANSNVAEIIGRDQIRRGVM